MTELMISSLLQKIPELLKKSPSETMTKYEAFRSLISQSVSNLSHPRPMNECANGCADLAVGLRGGAEGFTRKCVGAVRLPSRSSFGPLVWELRHPFGNPEVLIVLQHRAGTLPRGCIKA